VNFRLIRILVATLLVVPVLTWRSAAPVGASERTFLFLDSEPGEYVGFGEDHLFERSSSSMRAAVIGEGNRIHVLIDQPDGSQWDVNLSAPAGEKLRIGSYTNATRWPLNGEGVAGMDISGEGRGCSEISGSFEVLAADFGEKGVIHSFHATFEQFCEGRAPALIGELSLAGIPALPANTVAVTLDESGTVEPDTGRIRLYGTLACSIAPFATFDVTIVHNGFVNHFPGFSTCDKNGEPYAVDGYVLPFDQIPFVDQVTVRVEARDPVGDTTASGEATATVTFS
jgi:hypothetical protein